MRRQKILLQALYKTLLYSDVFDYPLTGEQLFQLVDRKVDAKDFFQTIKQLPHVISGRTLYYFLPKREKIVLLRQEKEKISIKKMQIVRKIASLLSLIPTIQYIGVSGSLALMQADKKSDSDLFFITKKNTVWMTRFFVYCFIFFLGKKRGKKYVEKAICANMFLDESALQFPKEKRNLYVAHEIVQLVSLINKNNTYNRFLLANTWVKKYFPNKKFPKKIKQEKTISFSFLTIPLEFVFRLGQLFYMRQKKTREVTDASRIAFHPIDYEKIILHEYEKRKRKYGI